MTAEEILKENTKHTLQINEGSPLHDAVIKAMEDYASIRLKEVEQWHKLSTPITEYKPIWVVFKLKNELTSIMCRLIDGELCGLDTTDTLTITELKYIKYWQYVKQPSLKSLTQEE